MYSISDSALFVLSAKAFRALFGLNQQQLADRIGLSKVGWARIETLKYADTIRESTVEALSNTLADHDVQVFTQRDRLIISVAIKQLEVAATEQGYSFNEEARQLMLTHIGREPQVSVTLDASLVSAEPIERLALLVAETLKSKAKEANLNNHQ